jgi:hypothetical protein
MYFLYAACVLYITAYASLSVAAWRASGRCRGCRNRESCPAAGALLVCDEYAGSEYARKEPGASAILGDPTASGRGP